MLTISLTTFCGVDVLDLELSFGFLVNDVARLFGRRFDHNGRRLGLTRAQCRTLGYLARNEGINQAGMADLLEIRPMTLVRQIDRMEEAGWIERRPDPTDRRARRLFLTAYRSAAGRRSLRRPGHRPPQRYPRRQPPERCRRWRPQGDDLHRQRGAGSRLPPRLWRSRSDCRLAGTPAAPTAAPALDAGRPDRRADRRLLVVSDE